MLIGVVRKVFRDIYREDKDSSKLQRYKYKDIKLKAKDKKDIHYLREMRKRRRQREYD
jgi:hypothetical protein